MAAEKTAGAAKAAEKGPFTGENPYDEGTPAWHGWAYLKSTVDADRAKGVDVTKVEKPSKPNIHAF